MTRFMVVEYIDEDGELVVTQFGADGQIIESAQIERTLTKGRGDYAEPGFRQFHVSVPIERDEEVNGGWWYKKIATATMDDEEETSEMYRNLTDPEFLANVFEQFEERLVAKGDG